MKQHVIGFVACVSLGAGASASAQVVPRFVLTWGSEGPGPGQFCGNPGIATDSMGRVYVTDESHRVQVFDADGAFLTTWGEPGDADGQLGTSIALAVDASGFVYVADTAGRLQKFDPSGGFVKKWASVCRPSTFLVDIKLDTDANVYVVDFASHCVQKFDSEGNFLLKWGTLGTGPGQFETPGSIAIDQNGDVYVGSNARVQKFDSDGNFILQWGQRGLVFCLGTRDGIVYVCDEGGFRLFTSDGAFLTEWRDDDVPPQPEKDERVFYATSMAFDVTQDVVYLGNHRRVLKFVFDPTQVESTTWSAVKQAYRR